MSEPSRALKEAEVNLTVCEEGCVVGVDPGLNVTGYGVVKFVAEKPPALCEAGVIRASARCDLPGRLATIFDGLMEVLETFQPTALALEDIFSHYQHPRAAIMMGHARGVICLAAAKAGVPVVAYAPTQIKRLLTGSGRAGKAQIQRAVQRELALSQLPEPPDVADALALALCHAYMVGNRERLVEAGVSSAARRARIQ